MNFPLLMLPTRVVYVDDKGNFLEVLRKTLPRKHAREFISSPFEAIDRLSKEADYWRSLTNLLSIQAIDADETKGFANRWITRYFNDWSRFHLTSVLNVDYAMPSLDGLEMIRRIGYWPGRRILLTGEADATVAIEAFNSGLIHKFIPKSTPNLYKVLKAAYEEMHRSVCEHMGYLIHPTLTAEQRELLSSPAVVAGLTDKVKDLEWVEYITVGAPFGLLGMGHGGHLQWLQLETAGSLAGLAEMVADAGYPVEDVKHVRDGSFLVNLELAAELRLPNRAPLREAEELSASPLLIAAVFDLNVPVLSAKEYGIDDIMSPLEAIRAQLRDIAMAAKTLGATNIDAGTTSAASGSLPAWDHDRSAEALMSQLFATCEHSLLHKQALMIAVADSALPGDLTSQIRSYLALDKAKQQQ